MKFKLLLILFAAIFTLKSRAQTAVQSKDTSQILTRFDTAPQFPGGFVGFDRYVENSSTQLLKPGHPGGLVAAEIVVEKTGKISQAKIIRSLTAETDSAAIYLLKNSPLWKPAFNNRQPVRALARVGVRFKSAMELRVVHVPDVVTSPGHNADITIDEPVDNSNTSYNPDKIYTAVEKSPEFPGGLEKFYQYLKDNRKVTASADQHPDRVIVTFIVEKDGSLTDIRVVRGVSTDCDAEALRLMKSSPKWAPGTSGGKPVRVQYSVPVSFKTGS